MVPSGPIGLWDHQEIGRWFCWWFLLGPIGTYTNRTWWFLLDPLGTYTNRTWWFLLDPLGMYTNRTWWEYLKPLGLNPDGFYSYWDVFPLEPNGDFPSGSPGSHYRCSLSGSNGIILNYNLMVSISNGSKWILKGNHLGSNKCYSRVKLRVPSTGSLEIKTCLQSSTINIATYTSLNLTLESI